MRSRGKEIAVAEWVVGRAFRAVLRTTMRFGCHIEDWKELVFRIRTSSTKERENRGVRELLDFENYCQDFRPEYFPDTQSLSRKDL